VEDRATRNKKIDKRRAQLAEEITLQQRIIDRYERQTSFQKDKNPFTWVTEEQYEAAKTARDKAQAERDELARQILN
jgi:hypothetical protein